VGKEKFLSAAKEKVFGEKAGKENGKAIKKRPHLSHGYESSAVFPWKRRGVEEYQMKVKVEEIRCKGYVWMIDNQVCPFVRCVYRNGFLAGRVKKNDAQRN
jgi:hypothetical protein